MKDNPPIKRRRYDVAFRAEALRLAAESRSTQAAARAVLQNWHPIQRNTVAVGIIYIFVFKLFTKLSIYYQLPPKSPAPTQRIVADARCRQQPLPVSPRKGAGYGERRIVLNEARTPKQLG